MIMSLVIYDHCYDNSHMNTRCYYRHQLRYPSKFLTSFPTYAMNKAVERDLLNLLPSITLPLPRELSEVAVSLLSQSRSKASSLRQDEEIARGYVCANIACDR